MTKKFYQSKTFWFNILTALAMFGAYLSDNPIIRNPEIVGIIVTAVAGINIILRVFFTDSKIE